MFFLLVPSAMAAVFSVDTRRDSHDLAPGDGVCEDDRGACSLRAAVMEANATEEADEIDLTDPTVGPHQLYYTGAGEDGAETGDLDIAAPLTITGDGDWIVGKLDDRLFHILPGVEGQVTFTDVNLTWGYVLDEDGGALLIDAEGAEVVLQNVEIVDNTVEEVLPWSTMGGAISVNAGHLDLSGGYLWLNAGTGSGCSGVPMPEYGGALAVREGASAVVEDSVFRNNGCDDDGNVSGSAIYTAGDTYVYDSSIYNNDGEHSAVAVDGFLLMVRSSVYGNEAESRAGGLVVYSGGEATLMSSTVAGNLSRMSNGTQVENDGTLRLLRSTVGPFATRWPGTDDATEWLGCDPVDDPGSSYLVPLYSGGVTVLRDSIVVSTCSGGAGRETACAGTLRLRGTNLIDRVGYASSPLCVLTGDTSLAIAGTVESPVDAELSYVALFSNERYGFPLVATSPAVDVLNASGRRDMSNRIYAVDGDGDGVREGDLGALEAQP